MQPQLVIHTPQSPTTVMAPRERRGRGFKTPFYSSQLHEDTNIFQLSLFLGKTHLALERKMTGDDFVQEIRGFYGVLIISSCTYTKCTVQEEALQICLVFSKYLVQEEA